MLLYGQQMYRNGCLLYTSRLCIRDRDINEQASETEMEDAYSKYARFEATDTRREDRCV